MEEGRLLDSTYKKVDSNSKKHIKNSMHEKLKREKQKFNFL